VAPCPIDDLTVDVLVSAFENLLRPDLRTNAAALASKMQTEDGVAAAVTSFYRHLPKLKFGNDLAP
jgi:hypothetical protein